MDILSGSTPAIATSTGLTLSSETVRLPKTEPTKNPSINFRDKFTLTLLLISLLLLISIIGALIIYIRLRIIHRKRLQQQQQKELSAHQNDFVTCYVDPMPIHQPKAVQKKVMQEMNQKPDLTECIRTHLMEINRPMIKVNRPTSLQSTTSEATTIQNLRQVDLSQPSHSIITSSGGDKSTEEIDEGVSKPDLPKPQSFYSLYPPSPPPRQSNSYGDKVLEDL